MKKEISPTIILVYLSIFFSPFQFYKISGLSIAEYAVLITIPISVGFFKNLFINKKIFTFLLSTIGFSLVASIVTMLDDSFYWENTGSIMYSFEFGFIFRLARIIVLFVFSSIVSRLLLLQRINLIKLMNIYVSSTTLTCILFLMTGKYTGLERGDASFVTLPSIFFLIGLVKYNQYKRRYQYFYSVLFILHLVSIFKIGSSAGIIILFIIWLIYLSSGKRKLKLYLLIASSLIVGIYLFNKETLEPQLAWLRAIKYKLAWENIVNPGKVTSSHERYHAVKAAINMALDYPLGVGMGNYGWFVSDYKESPFFRTERNGRFGSNNQYATFLAELGFLGLTSYILLLYIIYKTLRKNTRHYERIFYYYAIYIIMNSLSLNTIASIQMSLLIAFFIFFGHRSAWYYTKQ